MNRKIIVFILALFICVILSGETYGSGHRNDIPYIGSSIIPLKDCQVEMVSQRVSLQIVDSLESPHAPVRDILVTAEFVLKNHGEDVALEMGLPFPVLQSFNKPLTFEVIIDGNRIEYQEKDVEFEGFTAFYVWDYKISHNQEIHVITRYRILPNRLIEKNFVEPYFYSGFILQPASLWRGGIQRTIVSIDYNPKVMDIDRAFPQGAAHTYGRIEWEWLQKDGQNVSFQIWSKSPLQAFINPPQINDFDTDKENSIDDNDLPAYDSENEKNEKNDNNNKSDGNNKEENSANTSINTQELSQQTLSVPIQDFVQVEASSVLNWQKEHSSYLAFDGRPDTCWVEGGGSYGKGEWIKFNFSQNMEAEESVGFHLEKIGIVNGCYSSNESLLSKSRVKTAVLEFSNGLRQDISFLDQHQEAQWFDITPPMNTKWVKIIINETYPAKQYTDTAISNTAISNIFFRGTYSPQQREKIEKIY